MNWTVSHSKGQGELEGWAGQLVGPGCSGSQMEGRCYQYTTDLLGLDKCTPLSYAPTPMPLARMVTPLKLREWESALASHPDREYVHYLIRGIQEGFRVGFDRRSPLRSSGGNMPSAQKQAAVVEEYLGMECAEGRMVGPLDPNGWPCIHVNSFGVIPKSSPGRWRLITNLLALLHGSVNDGISKELSSLSYISVDWVAEQVVRLGKGTLLAKLDIQSAYRIVPVHPDDHCLLGVKWKGQVFVDCALSFGLRSACKIFTALADAVEWVASQRGALGMAHYLDDYIMWGAPSSKDCAESLRILLEVCSELGIPVASQKCQGPSTRLVFLGIEFDTMSMELRLPEEKLVCLQALVTSWRVRKSCQWKELESVVGHLHHACKVVRPGRRFLRGLLALLSRTHGGHHYAWLNESSRADIEWWHTFLAKWNGISVLRKPSLTSPEVQLHSDALGSWGCGAVWGAVWFQVSWHQQVPHKFGLSSIAVKELLPVILAAGIWGSHWIGCTVCCCCDNEAVRGLGGELWSMQGQANSTSDEMFVFHRGPFRFFLGGKACTRSFKQ